MPTYLGPIASAILALSVVLGLILLVARIARATGLARLGLTTANTSRRLTVLDTLVLDRARRLLLVRCDGKDLLLMTGGTADLVVGWVPCFPAAPEPTP